MPSFNGKSLKAYKQDIRDASLRYVNEYRAELGLEPIESLPTLTWREVLLELRKARQ